MSDPEPIYLEFGSWVRTRRKHYGRTQAELGDAVGLSRTSIVNIEGGRQRVLLHQYEAIRNYLSPEGAEGVRMYTDGLLRSKSRCRAVLAQVLPTRDPAHD